MNKQERIRKIIWDELSLGTFDVNIMGLIKPYDQYITLQAEAYSSMIEHIMDDKLISNIHSSNMFLDFGYIMTGSLQANTVDDVLEQIFRLSGFKFDGMEFESMRCFRDVATSQAFVLHSMLKPKNFIANAIDAMKKLDLSLIKTRMLESCKDEYKEIMEFLLDYLDIYVYKNFDEISKKELNKIIESLAKLIKDYNMPLLESGKPAWSAILSKLINEAFTGTGFKYSLTDENQQHILDEESYDYATLTDTVDMICFKDNNGDIVLINEQLVGFEFDWNDILDVSGTTAETHRNPFLLTDPFTLNYNDDNKYMPRADLERLGELYSADTLVGGDPISAELIGLRQDYEEYIDDWDHNKVTVNYRIFGVDLIGTNQKTNWINYIKNKRHDHLASTNTLSYGPHITNVLFSMDLDRQGLDMRNTEQELLYTRMAYSVIDHENQVVNRQLETWIVNLLRDNDDHFSLFRKSDAITYETIEEFFNFYKNGKIKAFYDGADPGIDHQYYSGIPPTKHKVIPVFAKVGFYEYENGTKVWGFLYEPIVIDGYGSSMEEYFSAIKNELMLKEGSELWYWVFGCPIIPR